MSYPVGNPKELTLDERGSARIDLAEFMYRHGLVDTVGFGRAIHLARTYLVADRLDLREDLRFADDHAVEACGNAE